MKQEEKNKVDVNEMGVAIGVDNEVIEKVRSGEITHIIVEINEDNQNMFLENFDGNLVLVTEELPDTFHGCYFYNGGEFPYAIKGVLEFLDLSSDDDHCLARMLTEARTYLMRWNPTISSFTEKDFEAWQKN